MFEMLPELTAPGDLLKARVKRVHNFIYANDAIKQHSRVFDEVAKVMLAKLEWERRGDRGPFAPLESEAAELIALGKRAAAFRRIQELYQAAVDDPEAEPIQLAPAVLGRVADELLDLRLLNTDAKGTAFQAIVGPQMRSEKGQFFTPDPAKRVLAAVLGPKRGEVVLDPACGSGGLLATLGHARLVGVEVDNALARVARLGLLLHAEATASIIAGDALAPQSEIDAQLPPWARLGSVDVVITNPPFGSKARVTDRRILRGLPNLGGTRLGQVPEILFIERILEWLRPGGRAGIVVPQGLLANDSLGYVRDFIRAASEVIAVVSLPPETFRPADNGIQAALLFIRKRGGTAPEARRVFMATVRSIGYDQHERAIYRPGPDGHPVVDEDVTGVIAKWDFENRVNLWF